MSFVVYTPKTRSQVSRGRAIFDKSGNCRLHPADLAEVGISGKSVVILTDAYTQRIALRAPNTDAEFSEPVARVQRGKSGGKASVGMAGPLAAIGISDVAKAAGEHEATIKDNLVIVNIYVNPPKKNRLADANANKLARS